MVAKLMEMEAALAADSELAAKYKEALDGAKDAGAKSDVEALCLAAAAAGFELDPTEVEQSMADAANLSEEDLEAVTGGLADFSMGAEQDEELPTDEFGHEASCVAVWHCLTAMLHTESNTKEIACWSDYSCAVLYRHN